MRLHLSTSQGLALQHAELYNQQAQSTLMSAGGEWQATSETFALYWTVQGHVPGALQIPVLQLCPIALMSCRKCILNAAGAHLLWQGCLRLSMQMAY